jgi:hypothetical protein
MAVINSGKQHLLQVLNNYVADNIGMNYGRERGQRLALSLWV